MRDVVEGLMDTLRWLWFPAFFPLGGIVVTYAVAFAVSRGAVRARRAVVPPPLITQMWAWAGAATLAVCAFLVVGMAILRPGYVLILAAWLSLPCALIGLSLSGSRARAG